MNVLLNKLCLLIRHLQSLFIMQCLFTMTVACCIYNHHSHLFQKKKITPWMHWDCHLWMWTTDGTFVIPFPNKASALGVVKCLCNRAWECVSAQSSGKDECFTRVWHHSALANKVPTPPLKDHDNLSGPQHMTDNWRLQLVFVLKNGGVFESTGQMRREIHHKVPRWPLRSDLKACSPPLRKEAEVYPVVSYSSLSSPSSFPSLRACLRLPPSSFSLSL